MSTRKRRPATETNILTALHKCHPAPAWAFMPKVRDATGFGGSRTADAIAMSVWPSRGLELHGFEIKSYRGDWLREFKNPEKAEAIAGFCHRFWIVGADESVVRMEEVPPKWGLMILDDGGIKIAQKAEYTDQPDPSWDFIASLLRGAAKAWDELRSEYVHRDSIDKEIEGARKRGEKFGRSEAKNEFEEDKELRENVRIFEEASGISIRSSWRLGKIGEAVDLISTGRFDPTGGKALRQSIKTLREEADRLEEVAQAMPAKEVGKP